MTAAHPAAVVPVLETERLVLRGHTAEDLADSAAMWADPVVTRYIGGGRPTEEESWRRLLQYAGLWAVRGFGYWSVREKASGRFVGETGFVDFRRELPSSFTDAPEAGWALATWARGQGFAGEAVAAIHAWADARFPRTVCMVVAGNDASVRVAERVGYRRYGATDYKDSAVILFERFSPSRTPG